MALTESEDRRIKLIETKLNDIQIALNNLAKRTELKQLLSIRQREIEVLKEQVSVLESQVATLINSQ